MNQFNEIHKSDEVSAEVSSLKLVQFSLLGMVLMIATMSVAIFLTMSI